MFGYVKPVHNELLVKEYEFYKATYCGICRAMKKHTGALSNVTLSYDSVFLAMVRMLFIDNTDFGVSRKRCIAHPLKRRPMLNENPAIEYTARAFAILSYHKALDDIADERLRRRMLVGAAKPILKRGSRKAGIGELSKTVSEKLCAITELERKNSKSVDDGATLFGELLGAVFSFGLSGNDRLVTYQCGFHLGKFIYSIDAADDYDEDRKTGKYNPYVAMYGGAPLTAENKENIRIGLLLECRGLESAINLLPFGERRVVENIIKNTVFLGLPKRMEFLISERSEKKEKED